MLCSLNQNQNMNGIAVSQNVEQVVCLLEWLWFDPTSSSSHVKVSLGRSVNLNLLSAKLPQYKSCLQTSKTPNGYELKSLW